MRRPGRAIAAGAILLGSASHALAINIGGLELPVGATFEVGQIYANTPTTIDDELAGYGRIDSINSTAVGSLCAGCELTYTFDGYRVASVSPSEIRFSGGSIKFYLGFGADNDFTTGNAGGSSGDLAEASNGTLFLTLKGHAVDAAANTFISTGTGIGTVVPTGFGTGLLDVDTASGGIASSFFDTNSLAALFGGSADLELGSSFSALNPAYPTECPGGAACVRGSVDLTTTVIPEPGSHVLLLAGLAAMTFGVRRRSASMSRVERPPLLDGDRVSTTDGDHHHQGSRGYFTPCRRHVDRPRIRRPRTHLQLEGGSARNHRREPIEHLARTRLLIALPSPALVLGGLVGRDPRDDGQVLVAISPGASVSRRRPAGRGLFSCGRCASRAVVEPASAIVLSSLYWIRRACGAVRGSGQMAICD